MIGIIGAMKIEIKTLSEMIENKKSETISGIEFLTGTIFGKDVCLAVCGVGKVFASICTQIMILKYSPEAIINTGVAGTLTDKLSIGDIAVSKDVVHHDLDTSACGDEIGLISGINIIKVPADEVLCKKLVSAMADKNLKYLEGTIASGDQFIASSDTKKVIVQRFGAIAAEMESASIGQVCYVNNVPFCAIRAISDCADGNCHENYAEFLHSAANTAVSVMKTFIKNY